MDVTQLAISLIKNRLQDAYGRRLKFVSGSESANEKGGARVPRAVSGVAPDTSDTPSAHKQSSMQEISHAPGVIGVTPMTAGGTPALPETSIVRIIGEPTTPNEAATLAEEDKYEFQWWVLGLVSARPVERKKGADHGIDGKLLFRDDPKAARPEQIIIQVKGGKTGVKDV
ncbi:MAG: hypothetical protein KGJ60_12465, partial [Verrucomicrobiota bacterium]|nr:hypothetical protein [Verrucomicrobiota bacterium]